MEIERNARTQVLYRVVNDRISELHNSAPASVLMQVMCECGQGCGEQIAVAPNDYAAVRRAATYFVVAPGHHYEEVDRLVEDRGSWLLVEAVGVAADIARNGPGR